ERERVLEQYRDAEAHRLARESALAPLLRTRRLRARARRRDAERDQQESQRPSDPFPTAVTRSLTEHRRPSRTAWRLAPAALLILLASCSSRATDVATDPAPMPTVPERPPAPSGALLDDVRPSLTGRLPADATKWIDQTLASLSLHDRVAQMVMVWVLGDYTSTTDSTFATAIDRIELDRVGGVIMS